MSEIDVAKTLNHHFIDSVKRLADGDTSSSYLTDQSNISDPIANIIHKFGKHLSIISIQRNAILKNFFFRLFEEEDISSEIPEMKSGKVSIGILTRLLGQSKGHSQ